MLLPSEPIRAGYQSGLSILLFITDLNGFFFNFTTQVFESYGLNQSYIPAYFVSVPEIGDSGLYQIPFPDAITIPGRYNASMFKDDGTGDNRIRVSSTRKFYVPSAGTGIYGHYGSDQPPYGAAVDLFDFKNRSISGAWPMIAGLVPINALCYKTFPTQSNYYQQKYTSTQIDGVHYALVSGWDHGYAFVPSSSQPVDPYGWGCSVQAKLNPQSAFTILATILPVAGEVGPVLSFGALSLIKRSGGYALQYYASTSSQANTAYSSEFPDISDGIHRWALTFNFSYGLRLYCDGVLIYSNLTNISIAQPSAIKTVLWMGTLGNYDISRFGNHLPPDLGAPTCPAYHTNYQAHRRAFTQEEISTDFLEPYNIYLRPGAYAPKVLGRSRD